MSTTRQATRKRLIDATAVAAVEKGYRALTVADILTEASLSRRTFYQHFRNKEDAFLALYESVVNDLEQGVRAAVESKEDPIQRLVAGIEAYLSFQIEGGELLKLLQAEATNPVSLLSPVRERTLDSLVSLLHTEMYTAVGRMLDPLVFRSLFLSMEALIIHLRQLGPFTLLERNRAFEVMKPVFLAVLSSHEHMPEIDSQDF